MEAVIKKYQKKFRKAQDEVEKWEALQLRCVSLFKNASSIILRLHEIQDSRNLGALECILGLQEALQKKLMDQLETLLHSLRCILEEFKIIVLTFEKFHRDAAQLINTASNQRTNQLRYQILRRYRIGIYPPIADFLVGLSRLHEMHESEYRLKLSLFSALCHAVIKSSSADHVALQQLMVDQPNIPKEELQYIFDITLSKEMG